MALEQSPLLSVSQQSQSPWGMSNIHRSSSEIDICGAVVFLTQDMPIARLHALEVQTQFEIDASILGY
jgi:hypothetical protein